LGFTAPYWSFPYYNEAGDCLNGHSMLPLVHYIGASMAFGATSV